jgi:hypothetical protein
VFRESSPGWNIGLVVLDVLKDERPEKTYFPARPLFGQQGNWHPYLAPDGPALAFAAGVKWGGNTNLSQSRRVFG